MPPFFFFSFRFLRIVIKTSLFGEIRANLEKEGKVIGGYDMLIAAHALSEGLILVTNNVKEFSRIGGLIIDNWV